MSYNIGSETCDFLKAELAPPTVANEVQFSTRPGVAGTRAEKLGYRGGPFILKAWKFDTLSNVKTWRDNIAALAGGAAVTITPDDGDSWSNCYIGRKGGPPVEELSKSAVTEGNTSKYLMVIRVHGRRSAV